VTRILGRKFSTVHAPTHPGFIASSWLLLPCGLVVFTLTLFLTRTN
jgi:hypothetical protein